MFPGDPSCHLWSKTATIQTECWEAPRRDGGHQSRQSQVRPLQEAEKKRKKEVENVTLREGALAPHMCRKQSVGKAGISALRYEQWQVSVGQRETKAKPTHITLGLRLHCDPGESLLAPCAR